MRSINRLTTISVIFLGLSLVLISGISISSTAATLRVCQIGCNYQSIQKAINSSESGDIIRIQNGEYEENLRIDKEINLIGTSSEWVKIIPEDDGTPAISIGPGQVGPEIENVSIIGETRERGAGIKVTGRANLNLSNSRITNFRSGISAVNSVRIKFTEVEIRNSQNAIMATDKAGVTIADSLITSARSGVVAGDSSVLTLIGTEITGCERDALLARNTAELNILSSRISDNRAPGIVLRDFSRLKMEESQVSNNGGGGVLLNNSVVAKLTQNKITFNDKKNITVVSNKCGFSGPREVFLGKVQGTNNEIDPEDTDSICPGKFARITTSEGGGYSYLATNATYAFLGLIGAATIYFLISG